MPSISIGTFSQIIESQIAEKNYRPIFGLGKGGIGKTESIAELAHKLNIGYIDIRLLLYSETDLKGVPYPNQEHTKTIWLQNSILPTEETNPNGGILVFDEITSCSRTVRTAAYQLLNERKLNDYKLPDNWLIVCLGNGEEDGGDYQGIEANFINRCSVFNVVTSIEDWKAWAISQGVNDLVLAYLSFQPDALHSYNPDKETELLFASPRSWKAVSDIMNTNQFDYNNQVLRARLQSNLGIDIGGRFMAFCKHKEKTVDVLQILNQGLRSTGKEDHEVTLITIQTIAKTIINKIKADMHDQNGAITENTIIQLANGINWILSTPKKEYQIMGIKDLVSFDKSLMTRVMMLPQLRQYCPELLQFAKDNALLFR